MEARLQSYQHTHRTPVHLPKHALCMLTANGQPTRKSAICSGSHSRLHCFTLFIWQHSPCSQLVQPTLVGKVLTSTTTAEDRSTFNSSAPALRIYATISACPPVKLLCVQLNACWGLRRQHQFPRVFVLRKHPDRGTRKHASIFFLITKIFLSLRASNSKLIVYFRNNMED